MGRKPKRNPSVGGQDQARKNIVKVEPAKKTDKKTWPVKQPREIARLRGMRDILPDEYRYWNYVITVAERICQSYGFAKTEIPALEQVNLYERSTGKQTDVVSKEMYAFVDKDNERVALRPEATPSLARSYIEHGMFNLPAQPVRLLWTGSLFRREKPQAGRYRQFTSVDIELFGESSPVADAQVIIIGYLILKELGIASSVQINSIGDAVDRDAYVKKFVEYCKDRKVRATLSVDDKKRLLKNPLRVLDSKDEGTQKALEGAPQIIDNISDEARQHFVKVLEYLDEFDIPYTLNPLLVRGLDYYNRTVFEFYPEGDGAASQGALIAGGRYDGLIELMGGRPTPSLGWGLGVDRIVLKLKEKETPQSAPQFAGANGKPDIFLAQLGDAAKRKAMVFFEELRVKGYRAAQNFVKDNLKTQLEQANKLGVKLTLILGQKEIMDNTILIRDMESGMQEVFDFDKVYEEIDKRLK